MFFFLPTVVDQRRRDNVFPLANTMIVIANVLLYPWSASMVVGPGTGLASILTSAFAHANLMHLIGNMWFLCVFGTPVNRRLGNGIYLTAYLAIAATVGLIFRLLATKYALGASGAISGVMAICVFLMPAAMIRFGYTAFFPLTVLIGIFSRPRYGCNWFIRWGTFSIRAGWGILFVPLMECLELMTTGFNWTNVIHLLGFACGMGVLLLLPERVSLGHRRYANPWFKELCRE
ncbi:MAG: rhomboid family intramembrane serine protease [Planctomycetia bacterium]|nr:rhomboid family intramembrane serine protease [Planctomycetia bacterium]